MNTPTANSTLTGPKAILMAMGLSGALITIVALMTTSLSLLFV